MGRGGRSDEGGVGRLRNVSCDVCASVWSACMVHTSCPELWFLRVGGWHRELDG